MIYVMALVAGGLFALVVPTLSIYLADDLHVRPLLIGSVFLCMALTSVFYSQIIGFWSDRLVDKRKVICLSLLCGAAGCFGFSVLNSFSGVLLMAISFFSLSYTAMVHVLSSAKNYADEHIPQHKIERFHTILNRCVVLSLLLGPALGFALLTQLSYSQLYMLLGGVYILFAFVALILLPRATSTVTLEYENIPQQQRYILLAGISAFVLLFAAHHAYVIALPIFMQQEFGAGHRYVSLLYLVSAAIQWFIVCRWTSLQPSSRLCILAAIAGVLLNLLVWQAHVFWLLMAGQLFLAIYVGWGIGMGLRWLRLRLPKNDTSAPTLFFNTLSFGFVVGSVGFATFSELYGLAAVFLLNVLFCGLAIIIFVAIELWERSNHR